MTKYLIGLTGDQGCGKSTTADMVKSLWEPRTKVISFADPIKKIAQDIFAVPNEVLQQTKLKNHTTIESLPGANTLLVRTLLQGIGKGFRNIYDGIFIELLHNQIKDCEETIIVIPDVRFPNEASYIRGQGGCIVKILGQNKDIVGGEDPSETERKKIKSTYVIRNQSNEDDLLEELSKKLFPNIPQKCFEKTYEGYYKKNIGLFHFDLRTGETI